MGSPSSTASAPSKKAGKRSAAARLANAHRRGIDYAQKEKQLKTFVAEYWIPANISARLLNIGHSAAYEWTAKTPKAPRRAWSYSPLHSEGQTRRQISEKAGMLYQQENLSMREVSSKLNVSLSAVHTYLKVQNAEWYSLIPQKHKAFARRYPKYARKLKLEIGGP